MKWIYKYLDAARNETEMGPYSTKLEAELASEEHHSYGAITSGAIEVPDDYKPFKPDYEKT